MTDLQVSDTRRRAVYEDCSALILQDDLIVDVVHDLNHERERFLVYLLNGNFPIVLYPGMLEHVCEVFGVTLEDDLMCVDNFIPASELAVRMPFVVEGPTIGT